MKSVAIVCASAVLITLAACSAGDAIEGSASPPPPSAPAPADAAPRLGPAQPSGGVLLEADGTIVAFGGVKLDTGGAPAWPAKDIARALVALADGSGGWVLDAFGAIHAFGRAPAIASRYASQSDSARALVVLSDQQSGYVLDRDGRIHAFGAAAPLDAGWTSIGAARGLDVHMSGAGTVDGGWVLDAFGGMHAFGAALDIGAPPAFKDYDVWSQLHVVSGGAYAIGRFGIIQPLGDPGGIPLAGLPETASADVVRDIVPISVGGAFDMARALSCPGVGSYCGADGIIGSSSVLYSCVAKGGSPAAALCAHGCKAMPAGTPDYCVGALSCANEQWWNTALTYGPVLSNGWWDTDLGVKHDTEVIVRHDSKLYKTGVYAWGYMPEFVDLVTGESFRFVHLRPQHQLATSVGHIYPAGTVVGYSGGDTADTGMPTYSTGAHLCVQTLVDYRTAFPKGKDACQ